MAGTAACCTTYVRCCPFSFPVQPQSTELPATTEGRWRRRHLSPGHKAGLLTVLLTCTGCAFQVTPGFEKGVTLKRATNPRTGGYHPKNWTHDSDTLAVPSSTSFMVSSCFSAHSCVSSVSRHKLTAGHNQSPLRLDKPCEFSRTPRSASATEGCQECPRESRGDRVMSHDTLNCPEASTWHIQLFLSCWSSRTLLSSGLRRFSVSRPRAASPQCVSAACTASSCHMEGRRESSMVCTLFSPTPLYGVQLLPR